MRKIILLSIIFFIAITSVFGKSISIKGTVIDETIDEPMSFVSVVLFKDSVSTKGVITDESGKFEINDISPGKYSLRAIFMGYQTYQRNINLTGNNAAVNLGKIYLKEDAQLLKEFEIVVQATQMTLDIEKKTFSVDQNIAAAGGSITEVLENIPSVEVDTDGNVSLRNDSNVEIWINGKPAGLTEDNRAQVLEQMSAGSVESVELITNPSAKYSPEGSAGIINLVMKKEREAGYFGSVNAGLDYAIGADKPGERAGVNFNFNAGKFDGYINLGFRNTYNGSNSKTDRYYYNESSDTIGILNQRKEQENNMLGITGRVGLNYQINDKNTVGVSGFIMGGGRDSENHIDYFRDKPFRDYIRDNDSDNERNTGNVILDHAVQFNKNIEWRSSISYSFYNSDTESSYVQQEKNDDVASKNQIQDLKQNNSNIEFKSDFTKRIGKTGRLETGVNIKTQSRESFSETSNMIGTNYVPDNEMFNDYSYEEELYALYANYGAQINKFAVQAGLRGEYIRINTATNDNSSPVKEYIEPFPTVFFSYSLPKQNEIQLNYTRRINRPRGNQLNSFRNTSDSTNISSGNPDLEPEFANAIEFNHIKSWQDHILSSSLYYRYTDNVIQRVRFLDEGVMNTTSINISQSQSLGFEFVSRNTFTKFLNLTTTLNLYYYKLNDSKYTTPMGEMVDMQGNDNFSWTIRSIANLMFTKDFSGQITGNYRAPQTISQGSQKGMYTVDLGLRKTFLDKNLKIALSVRDVLHSRKSESETESAGFWQYTETTRFGPTFRLTATYNFGRNNKKKADRNNSNGNQHEEVEDGFEMF